MGMRYEGRNVERDIRRSLSGDNESCFFVYISYFQPTKIESIFFELGGFTRVVRKDFRHKSAKIERSEEGPFASGAQPSLKVPHTSSDGRELEPV